eukprot:4338040-Amphidinium_carterae.1
MFGLRTASRQSKGRVQPFLFEAPRLQTTQKEDSPGETGCFFLRLWLGAAAPAARPLMAKPPGGPFLLLASRSQGRLGPLGFFRYYRRARYGAARSTGCSHFFPLCRRCLKEPD